MVPITPRDPRDWLLVDLDRATVRRAAVKSRRCVEAQDGLHPHLDGDFVVCINADKVKFTGNKLTQQTYNKFTGYLQNMKTVTAEEMLGEARP